ncbi:LuxR family transcriptional regulator [Agrobacterium rhizogenes]|uniref:helix-turn-helix transcriptional regulator n=1 Tax=Rhizobium rhizogenes TaxID=359 RepID=UPI0015727ADA|nr:LuxR C-terminal-related transcriptional regulator [Rhizobium rhizogenes]NTF59585.1 LuxR family transcriptional regulator [Rhizobium rhizogenes]NTF79145.1 LuxR family transcriptional regulator [Rhizobium rhizogenes]NTG18401.1 LuxR family transcriptional regulator [Rhizobium rhizogenes]NTH55537.1 LuxR family transcriptional regulator [Rhizobium rhizogenes]NTH75120.1 LuxR family transcriptional regulator [Rhizobium rhizogenes]
MASTDRRSDIASYADLSSVPAIRRLHDNAFIDMLRKAVPFEYVTVGGLDLEGYEFGRSQSIDTNMPPLYMETYFAEKMSPQDPLIAVGKTRKTSYTEEEAFDLVSPPERLVYLGRAHSIRNRILFPLCRKDAVYGAVCFTSVRPLTQGEFEFLSLMAEPLHAAVTKPIMDRFAASQLRLTKGELLCLKLASRGLTSEETAVASDYAVETVNGYLKSAVRKLRASNRVEAVAEAIRKGLID